jgi:hypothetical protein
MFVVETERSFMKQTINPFFQKIDLSICRWIRVTTMSSQSNLAITATSFDASSDFKYAKPRINKAGGKAIGVLNSSTNRQLLLTTPLMLTWGVNKRTDDETGRVSFDMSLQFPSEKYPDPQAQEFLDAMIAFEDQIKADAIKNSKAWLNQAKLSEEGVNLLFNNMLYWPVDKMTGERIPEKGPTLRVKLDYYDDAFNCEIYDLEQKLMFPKSEDGDATPEDLITKGSSVACVLKCGGLYFVNGKFGVTWRLAQAVVKPRASIKGQCLITLSAEEKQRMAKQQAESDDEGVPVEVQDDDDDSSVQEEVAKEVASKQPTVVKKKVVRRKKATE